MRRRILEGLECAEPVRLANADEVGEQCLAVHDALDAVVAALTFRGLRRQPAGHQHTAGW